MGYSRVIKPIQAIQNTQGKLIHQMTCMVVEEEEEEEEKEKEEEEETLTTVAGMGGKASGWDAYWGRRERRGRERCRDEEGWKMADWSGWPGGKEWVLG